MWYSLLNFLSLNRAQTDKNLLCDIQDSEESDFRLAALFERGSNCTVLIHIFISIDKEASQLKLIQCLPSIEVV